MAVPGAALAASSGTVDESFTVNNVLTLTLSTSTINYGTLDPGQTSAGQSVTAHASGNVGWRLSVSGTAFTSAGNTMPATARQRDGINFVDGVELQNSATGAAADTTTVWTVAVPATQKGGTYTGTLTYSLSSY
ncbi:MAG TPA: hypothetical protein VGK53_12480 [Propionicimonas sp.]